MFVNTPDYFGFHKSCPRATLPRLSWNLSGWYEQRKADLIKTHTIYVCETVLERTSMLKACIFPKSLTTWGGSFISINCDFFFSCIWSNSYVNHVKINFWWLQYHQMGRQSRSYLPILKLTFAHTIYDQGIKNAMTQYPCCPVLPYKHAE